MSWTMSDQKKMPPSKEQFVHLDPDVFEKYFAGVDRKTAVDLYAKLANLFTKSIDKKIQTLSKALGTLDNSQAIVMSHQLKGSLLSLGATDLAGYFRQIEMGVNITSNEELLKILESKKDDLHLFLEELGTWVSILQTKGAKAKDET